MSGKKISIDQKLSSLYNFFCEREGIKPSTLETDESNINLFPRDVHEIKDFKSTIDYLKDYAKLQVISKSFSDIDGVKNDIENAQLDFKKLIEKKKSLIDNMPRPKRTTNNLYMYDFGDEFKEVEENKYKKACEERNRKVLSLKQDIKIYQKRIKELESLKKSFTKPEKIMEILFPEEYTNVKDNYTRLINTCVTAMLDGFSKDDLIGDDKIFKFDGENYKVNYNNARRFLSVIKSKKELLSASEYVEAEKEYKQKADKYEESCQKKAEYEESLKVTETEEFGEVTDIMNQITSEYNELLAKEEKMRYGVLSRVRNKIRSLIGLSRNVRVPKKIINLRQNFAKKIEGFVDAMKQDEKLERAFNAHQIACKVNRKRYFMDVDELEWAIPEIQRYGTGRIAFATESMNVEELKLCLKDAARDEKDKSKELQIELNETKKKKEEAFSHLNAKARKIVETQKEEDILKYVKIYYGVGRNREEEKLIIRNNLSPSGAAIILESILGRKNISWDNIVENYASVLGKHNLDNERIDMDKIVHRKVDYLKEKLVSMIQNEKNKDIHSQSIIEDR